MFFIYFDPMRTRIFLTGLLVWSVWQTAQAQIELQSDRPSFRDRLFLGGNIGLSFGDINYVELSPLVGYVINNRASAGIGVTYQYLEFVRTRVSSSVYGGRIFSRYTVFPNVFAHAEYEQLNLQFFRPKDGKVVREWVPGLLLGGGYFQPFGRRGGVTLMLLYNLLHDPVRSPYPSEIILRAGFVF